jgi:DHA1 family tetracycline resistance protein-like MFS transporter
MNFSNNKRSLVALLWIVFTDSLGWGLAFSVFAALFFNHQASFLASSVSDTTRHIVYESLLGIYSFFMFFFAPIIGGFSDRYGRKPALNVSMLGLSIGFIASALGCFYNNFAFLIFGRIISGMTAGSLSVAQAAVVDMSTPETKSFYLSAVVFANCLGFSFGPMLGRLFLDSQFAPIGTITFLIGAAMSLTGFFLILFFFKETLELNNTNKKINLLADFANIKTAFCKPILNKYLFSFLCAMLAYCLFFSNLPVFLHRLSLANPVNTGYILSCLVISLSLSTLLGGKYIFERFEKTKVVRNMQLFQLVIYFLIAMCFQNLKLNVLLFAMVSICFGLIYIGLLTAISDVTSKDWQGRVMGVIASISSLTWGIGSFLSGWLDHYSPSAALFFCAALILGSLAVLHRLNFKMRWHK